MKRSLGGVEPIITTHSKVVPVPLGSAVRLGLREAALPRPGVTMGAESLDGDLHEGARLSAFFVIQALGKQIRAEFDMQVDELTRPTRGRPTGLVAVSGESKRYGRAVLQIEMQRTDDQNRSGELVDSTQATSTLIVRPSRMAIALVSPTAIHEALYVSHPEFAEEYCQRIVTLHQAEIATQRQVS